MTNEGPYGLIESDELIPRWTYPIRKQKITRVEDWEIGPLPNVISAARMVNDIHSIHKGPEDETEHIDLDAEAEAYAKTGSRLSIKPRLHEIRNRSKSDDFGPENVIDIDADQVDGYIDNIERHSRRFKKMLLRNTVSRMLGFDIAAGETEAIARDCLKTDVEIDDDMVPYIEAIGNAEMVADMMKEGGKIPEVVMNDVLKEMLNKSFEDNRLLNKVKEAQKMRRMNHEFDGLVARPSIGMTRGLSDVKSKKKKQEDGQA